MFRFLEVPKRQTLAGARLLKHFCPERFADIGSMYFFRTIDDPAIKYYGADTLAPTATHSVLVASVLHPQQTRRFFQPGVFDFAQHTIHVYRFLFALKPSCQHYVWRQRARFKKRPNLAPVMRCQ